MVRGFLWALITLMQNAFRDSGSQLNSTELHSSKLNPPVSQRFDAEPENVPTPVP